MYSYYRSYSYYVSQDQQTVATACARADRQAPGGPLRSLSLSICIYTYMYGSLSLSMCIYIYIYIHIHMNNNKQLNN